MSPGSYEIPQEGNPNSTEDPKIKAAIKAYNESLNSSNKLEGSSLAAGVLGRFYTPTVIATEQTRENVAFGKLTTPDEVASVVLPSNGLIAIGYAAKWKSSVAGAGRAAIFLGASQLKLSTTAAVAEVQTEGTEFKTLTSSTAAEGLQSTVGTATFTTTGQSLSGGQGGMTFVFAEAGTYAVSIQFKATSGNVAVKERKLWIGVIGV